VYRGIKQEDIGVITPYRQQIKLLSAAVHKQNPLVEVLTADKSQGRDKDCIVISMVRSNDVGNVSDFAGGRQ
jgi:DNA replication ATP-dependent helicase Dna2